MTNPKEQYMNGIYFAVTGQKNETVRAWKKEKDLTNCQTCDDSSCPARSDPERFNTDAGGKLQCLRLAKYLHPFAFRNCDGRVVVIPKSIVKAIVGGASDAC